MTNIFGSLRSIMYELNYIDNVDTFTGFDNETFTRLQNLYPPERIHQFRIALQWAMTCYDFNFASLLPALPHTNQQIHTYLTRYHNTLEQHATHHNWPPIDLTTE